MPDSDGYPTDEEKAMLRTFSGTWREYMAYLKSIGNYWPTESFGWHEEDSEDHIFHRPVRVYHISTGGWSGNEELISIIDHDMFWFLYWEEHKRGGHYKFEIPLDQLDNEVMHIEWKKEVSHDDADRGTGPQLRTPE